MSLPAEAVDERALLLPSSSSPSLPFPPPFFFPPRAADRRGHLPADDLEAAA